MPILLWERLVSTLQPSISMINRLYLVPAMAKHRLAQEAQRILEATLFVPKRLTYRLKRWSSRRICRGKTSEICLTPLIKGILNRLSKTHLWRFQTQKIKVRALQRTFVRVSSSKILLKTYLNLQRACLKILKQAKVIQFSLKTSRMTSRKKILNTIQLIMIKTSSELLLWI